MSDIRVYGRIALMALFTLTLYGFRLLCLALSLVSKRLEQRLRVRIQQIWGGGMSWLCGLRIHVQGAPPPPPFYLVSNHLSYTDIYVLSKLVPGGRFIAKDEIARWPFFGMVARSVGTVFIDRGSVRDTRRVNEIIEQVLDGGDGVIIFAEGGVSKSGGIDAFKPALLEPAVQQGKPVHYCVISYRSPEGYPPASAVAWWKPGVELIEHFRKLGQLPYLDTLVEFGPNALAGADRKELARALTDAARSRFTSLA